MKYANAWVSVSRQAILRSALILGLSFTLPFTANTQTRVSDIFGRSLNQQGVTLVDWDGSLANPLITINLLPPTNAALPGSITLTADGGRLYFDTPSDVGPSGPSKTVSLTSATARVPVRLSVFPDRDSVDEDYTLTLVFTGANSVRQTNTIPIHVLDQDLQLANDFVVTVNFDRDHTGVFTNATRRALTTQAANDWTYFFTGMNLDPVPAGTEQTYIWSNNLNGGYYFTSTNAYTGYLLCAYGTTNSAHRFGGEASFNGGAQTSGGRPLALHRFGGFESEIYGNYNTLGRLFSVRERAARANFFSAAPRASGKSFKSRAICSTGRPWRPTAPGPTSSRSSKAIRSDFPSAFIAPSSFLELISSECNRAARRCG